MKASKNPGARLSGAKRLLLFNCIRGSPVNGRARIATTPDSNRQYTRGGRGVRLLELADAGMQDVIVPQALVRRGTALPQQSVGSRFLPASMSWAAMTTAFASAKR